MMTTIGATVRAADRTWGSSGAHTVLVPIGAKDVAR